MGIAIIRYEYRDGKVIADIHEDIADTTTTITYSTTQSNGTEDTYSKKVYEDNGETETLHVKVYMLKEEIDTDNDYKPLNIHCIPND